MKLKSLFNLKVFKFSACFSISFFAYCMLLPAMVFGGSYWFHDNYSLSRDFQDAKSMKWTWYLIEKNKPKELIRGDMYTFYADQKHKDWDFKFVKELVGLPGDTVEITPQKEIKINGKVVRNNGMYHARELKMTAEQMYGKMTLRDNEYYFLGTTINSFDSRYFGAVHKTSIMGRAYGIY